MRAISTGSTYKIFDDTLRTYEKLPVQTYVVRFDRQTGFYLEKYVDITIPEEKIYGVHIAKIEKVLASFAKFNRSLGVILSGDKGIGKSLFAKLLSIKAMEKGIPLIVVDTYYPGIASYLEAIAQETMVLFDEFDKTFGEVRSEDGEASPQTGLLSLFDGISGGKKLYVITCNELYKLNEYLVNRPGRFHYHFRFDYPSALEIREYMMDKIPEERYGEIDEVISFATKVNLNYDCLRAIAFEICAGETFKSAIRDLNIINLYEERYEVILLFKNGYKVSKGNASLDLFGGDEYDINFHDARYNDICTVYFSKNGINKLFVCDRQEIFSVSNTPPCFACRLCFQTIKNSCIRAVRVLFAFIFNKSNDQAGFVSLGGFYSRIEDNDTNAYTIINTFTEAPVTTSTGLSLTLASIINQFEKVTVIFFLDVFFFGVSCKSGGHNISDFQKVRTISGEASIQVILNIS